MFGDLEMNIDKIMLGCDKVGRVEEKHECPCSVSKNGVVHNFIWCK